MSAPDQLVDDPAPDAAPMPYGESLLKAFAALGKLPGAALSKIASAEPSAPEAPPAPVSVDKPAPALLPEGQELGPVPPPAPPAPVAAASKAAGRTRAAPPANATPPSDGPGTDAVVPPPAAGPEAPAPNAGPYQTPVIAAYMADRAARMAELKGAQADAEHRRGIAQAENVISSAFTSQGDDVRRARLEAAGQPVADVLARQKAGDEALAQAGQLQDFSAKADSADPNSDTSKRVQDLLGRLTGKGAAAFAGIPAAQFPQFEALVKQQSEREKTAAELQKERETRKSAEGIAARHEAGENYRASEKFQREQALKPVDTKTRTDFDAGNAALEANDTLREQQKNVGPSGLLAPFGIHIGAEGEYHDTNEATKGVRAQAEYPTARGVQGAQIVAKTSPKGYQSADRAGKNFDQQNQAILNRQEQTVRSLEASHPGSPEVAQMRQDLEANKRRFAPGGGGERKSVGGRNFVKINGKWHEE